MYDETGYHPPDWSAMPKEAFNLEVLKDGLIIDTIYLASKDYFTLGRQHDIVDIPMDHPSISRMHAVLNYRNDGSLMLLDLNSAQGTYLNKSICEKNVYHRVYVGDIVKFGASTRKYIVNGPDDQRLPEYNSANLINLREKLQLRSKEIKRKLERDQECSWGFSEHDEDECIATSSKARIDGDEDDGDEDDGDEEDDSRRSRFLRGDKGLADLPEYLKNDENYDRKYGDKYAVNISESIVKNEKDVAIHDKIRVKEKKIQNMQEENRRIYMKEASQDGGLTDGQTNAVKRNDANIIQIKNDIDNLVKQLQIKEQDRNRNSNSNIGSGKKRRDDDDDDDDDEVLDETGMSKVNVETNFRLKKKLKRNQLRFHGTVADTTSNRALSYQDINNEIMINGGKLLKINEQMDVLNRRIQSLTSTIGSDNDGRSAKHVSNSNSSNQYRDASIDDIIVTNQIQEYTIKLTALHAEKLELDSKHQGLQRLLAIATPALKSLIQKSSIQQQHEVEIVVGVSKELPSSTIDLELVRDYDNSNNKDTGCNGRIIIGDDDDVRMDGSNDHVIGDKITASTNHTEAIIFKSGDHNKNSRDNYRDNYNNSISVDSIGRVVTADISFSVTTAVVPDLLKETSIVHAIQDSGIEASHAVSNRSSSVKNMYESVNNSVGGSRVEVDHLNHDVHVNQKKTSVPVPLKAKVISAMSSKAVVRNEDQLSFKSDVLEGGEYVWVPPKMQTGDGKTNLNAKYGY